MELELSNGLTHFWQWDTNQSITVTNNIPRIDFKISNDTAVYVEVVNNVAEIPDECFQSGEDLILWAYKTDHTVDAARVPVEYRVKPADYVYTKTETQMWHTISDRMKAIETTLETLSVPDNLSSGSWTPTLSGMATYSYQKGRYFRIGDVAIVSFAVWGTMTGSNTERIKITGCPFTPADSGYGGGGWLSGYYVSDDIVFSGWTAHTDGGIYAYGQIAGTGNKWGQSAIYQKTNGECGGGGTIMFKVSS